MSSFILPIPIYVFKHQFLVVPVPIAVGHVLCRSTEIHVKLESNYVYVYTHMANKMASDSVKDIFHMN